MQKSSASYVRLSLCSILAVSLAGCGQQDGGDGTGGDENPEIPTSDLVGDYVGQVPPGEIAELFAPGLITTATYTRDVAMTPDGSELYFGVLLGPVTAIIETHRGADGVWTEPEVAPFSTDSRFFNLEPAISPDGSRFMFLSTRVEGREPEEEELRTWSNQDIWVMDREGDHWGEPYNLGAPVNTEGPEFYPSMTRDKTLYFTRGSDDGAESIIYRSRLVDGAYREPERLGSEVNSTPSQFNAFIAPDEGYLIVCTGGREDSIGGTDYYVVFRSDDDRWSPPINMGDVVNTPGDGEFSPYVSPDGRYFFFMSTRLGARDRIPPTLTWEYIMEYRTMPEIGNAGIYWVDAGFIEDLRPEGF
jgi:hypothetical protein